MRLAADYQQRNKKTQQPHDTGRKYIVRLGKGLPNEQKRKRGISLSKANSRISEQSLGKNQISKQKQMEQQILSTKQYFYCKPHENDRVVTSAAVYGNRTNKIPQGYAFQHLVRPQVDKELQRVITVTKYLSGVKSHQNLFRKQQADNIRDNVAKYIPPKQIFKDVPLQRQCQRQYIRPISVQKINLVTVNPKLVSNSSNIDIYPERLSQIQHKKLFRSNPIIKQQNYQIHQNYGQPVTQRQVLNSPQHKVVTFNVPQEGNKVQLTQTTKNTEKMSLSKQDPYNLSSSKLTKKYDEPINSQVIEELQQTKKYYNRGLPPCKQMSSSSSVSASSKRLQFSNNGFSLWDANKVESIISLKESRQIKVQQSQILMDYFNPSESTLRRI